MIYLRCFRILVCVLCTSIVFSIIPQNLGRTVEADTTINSEDESHSYECFYRSVEEASFTVEVKTSNKWACHSNLEIRFKNTGTVTIHDWYFTFDFDYAIENPYNCFVLEHKDNLYTIGNNNWNQDILPGQSVTVGFTASSNDGGDIVNMPSFYLLNTKTIRLTDNDLAYRYEEYSDWTYGYNGALILSNVSGNEIRDWTITFNANRSVKQADSLMLSINSDGSYTITNDGNNQNISKGQSYRIGIQGGEHDPSIPFDISNLIVSAKILALRLDDDNDNNGIADVLDIKNHGDVTLTPTVKPTDVITPIATDTPTPITATPTASLPTSTPIITVTPEPTITAMPTITASPTPEISVTPINTVTVIPTIMPTGIPDDIDYDTDSDSDGLPDDLEEYYGTDKDNPDSDGDGVNDFYELMLSTDPLVPDSNGNSDYDMDGLTNKRESELGTNPLSRDTDLDRLSDGEEVSLYGTDPNKYDTDEDGISDYNEIRLGSSPSFPDSEVKRYQTMEFEPSGEDSLTGVAKVIVSGYISGSMLENTKIRDIYGKDLHTSSIEALVGDPVNIESTGEFDSMTITFEYTDDLNEKNLRVMWYDENNYEYVVLNNYTLNRYSNTISITTDHFSKYMLIDEEVWVNTWINACYEVDHTTNMFIGGYLRSPSSYKDYMIDRFGDDDHDGLANVWEEGGMINNIGHVVHSNPGKRLSDDDSLADGVEMGKLSSLEDIFERSPYTTYRKNGYPVSAGSRWEDFAYFKCISDVELSDSDYDGAFDGDDATSNDKNGPINYILIARDHDGEDMLSCMRQPYINAFNELGQKVVILEMWKESDYYRKAEEFYYRLNAGREVSVFTTFIMAKSTFDWLQYDLEANTFTSKNAYTHVEKMIIIAHGASNRIEFDINDSKDGYISSEDVINAVNPVCKINLFDIQACYCAKPSDYSYEDINHKTIDTTTCIAYEFFKKDNIQKVYAWTDQSGFAFGQNVSLLGAYVVFYYEAEGGVGLREVKSNRYFWIWPAYKPLYYGS